MQFKNSASADIHSGIRSRKARLLLPEELHEKAARLIDRVAAARELRDLASSPGLKLEKLKGKREEQYSLRINDQYRIVFEWENAEAVNVEIIDYH